MPSIRPYPLFGVGLVALAVGLGLNSVLGPLVLDRMRYPFTETVVNETIALEAVTLILVAPLALVAGFLALRGHRAAPFLAFAPTAYAAYMLVQYVVGPQYPVYQPSIAFHLALFVLSGALLLRAWALADIAPLRMPSRRWAVVVLLLAGFVVSRWAGALAGMTSGEPVPAAAPDLTMYWSIFLLDLGLVVPFAVAAAVGLLTGSAWARKALYVVVGWFALVPPSVAAMSVVKILRDDPNAVPGDTIVLVVMAIVFALVAVRLYLPFVTGTADLPPGRPLTAAPVPR